MIETTNKKFIFIGLCFLLCLCISFFCYPTNKIFAAGLEIQYPIISGQNINTEVNLTLPSYVKYLFNGGMFLGFLAVFVSLIIAGVMYFLSPISVEMHSGAKDRFSGAISGLLILALTYLIITTINPQLSILNINQPTPVPPPPVAQKPAGVYFYKTAGCPDNRAQPYTADVPDLAQLKNKINSVGTIQNPDEQAYYISILYDAINLQGKCQYLNPNQACQSVSPFAASASVNEYDLSPNGDGIYFFRKSCFNNQISGQLPDTIAYCKEHSGGYYKIENSQINGAKKLDDLKFQNVPEEEQDCAKYDNSGKCSNRTPPSLAGENISSIIINGNYLVLLVYMGPQDSSSGPWTSCQAFPTVDDINRIGPQQIKWEKIKNNGGVVPNYVIILPIKKVP
ncbi:MAG: hypothetical protein NT155_02000 [Candidatus Staskawiczbacteria bacterium]|nr:hypothetical protein [Candidatus Staskawiczbacteria bacterium]